MKKFQYLVVQIEGVLRKKLNSDGGYIMIPENIQMVMNELGENGWEFIQNDGPNYYFKREK